MTTPDTSKAMTAERLAEIRTRNIAFSGASDATTINTLDADQRELLAHIDAQAEEIAEYKQSLQAMADITEAQADKLQAEIAALKAELATARNDVLAEVAYTEEVLAAVRECWQSRPTMDGRDLGHFDQTRLRELRPCMDDAISKTRALKDQTP